MIFLGFCYLLSIINFSFNFLQINLEVILLQTLLLYYVYRLFLVQNVYQLAGYASLLLIILAVYLFWLQFDVFACFVLVAESIVILFVLSILLHLNYTNLVGKPTTIVFYLILILPLCIQSQQYIHAFTYWVDWYHTQTSQYNDLLPQYLYFYVIDSPIVYLTGLWLLFLTFLLVHLILSITLSKHSTVSTILYSRKVQNIWSQWYKKPVIRFFNKN